MDAISHDINGRKFAELLKESSVFSNLDEALDIIGNLGYEGYEGALVHEESLEKAFFDLKTGLAGDILQKFSNYRLKLAIIGDFGDKSSKSLRDFIRESNRQGEILFLDSVEGALLKWTS